MGKLYLIRHGQTDWNLIGRIQGCQDIPLNAKGRSQADALRQAMAARPVDAVYVSPLIRARATAQVILSLYPVPERVIKNLEEIHYGLWEGMSLEEIKARYPGEYDLWWRGDPEYAPPGGESLSQAMERTAQAAELILNEMKEKNLQAAAVVSHGASISCMLNWLILGNRRSLEKEFPVYNAAVTTVEVDGETGKCWLKELNDSFHRGGELQNSEK